VAAEAGEVLPGLDDAVLDQVGGPDLGAQAGVQPLLGDEQEVGAALLQEPVQGPRGAFPCGQELRAQVIGHT
jgi:hypothetical protein